MTIGCHVECYVSPCYFKPAHALRIISPAYARYCHISSAIRNMAENSCFLTQPNCEVNFRNAALCVRINLCLVMYVKNPVRFEKLTKTDLLESRILCLTKYINTFSFERRYYIICYCQIGTTWIEQQETPTKTLLLFVHNSRVFVSSFPIELCEELSTFKRF